MVTVYVVLGHGPPPPTPAKTNKQKPKTNEENNKENINGNISYNLESGKEMSQIIAFLLSFPVKSSSYIYDYFAMTVVIVSVNLRKQNRYSKILYV